MSILDRIVADKMKEVSDLRSRIGFESLMEQARLPVETRGFKEALIDPKGIALIAEIKKASPSKGLIREDFDPATIAEAYETAGASAISVLTEMKYFQGHPDYLGTARKHSTLPLLRKDFIVDPIQVPESRIIGADAILLIVAALRKTDLIGLLGLAQEIGLDVLVEVHNESELDCAIEVGSDIIGINNRNLATFEVDLQTTFDLVSKIPKDVVVVSESGIASYLDISLLRDAGVNAVLVGETLMRSTNIVKSVHDLMGR